MVEAHSRSSQPEAEHWHLFTRISIRFAFCYIVLYYLRSVLMVIPWGGWLSNFYSTLSDRIVGSAASHLLNIDLSFTRPATGSGDTVYDYLRQAATLLFAAIGGLLWTVLDRKRSHYIYLHGWLRVFSRYALSIALFSYAFAKIIPTQFHSLSSGQLDETYGQSSPMGLLWNFMGFSTAYTIFCGLAELIPAVLLLFRRTALLGSILAVAVMLNVVMLNFCYDVPVKLYSLNLLLLAIFLTVPDGRRLFRLFVLNRPSAPSDLRKPNLERRWQRLTAVALKTIVLATFLAQTIHGEISRHRMLNSHPQPSGYPLTSRGFHWIQEDPYNK